MVKIEGDWQLQNAKNKFSEVVNRAISERAQLVTKNGKPAVYVVSAEEYNRMQVVTKKPLKELLLSRPHKDVEIEIERQNDSGREIEL